MKAELTLKDITPLDEYTREEYIAFLVSGVICVNDLLNAREQQLCQEGGQA